MLYSTWQFMVKKKMQEPVKIFLRGLRGSLYITCPAGPELRLRPGGSLRYQGWTGAPANAVKSAFSMRLTQKTAPSRPETENHMLYSIRWRPQIACSANFRALGFTRRPEYAI